MVAAAANTNTPQMGDEGALLYLPVEDNVHCYAGAMAAVNAAGFVAPATAAAGWHVLGRFEEECDNTLAGHVQGGKSVTVRQGVFKWANLVGDLVVAGDRTDACYIQDDLTVRHTAGGVAAAGLVVQIDTDGVWVRSGLEMI